MARILSERLSAKIDESFVVFIIGMRVNQLSAIKKWWPIASAMGKMIRFLRSNKQSGFLHEETFFRLWPPSAVLITYWKSFDHLEKFAKNPAEPHLPVWLNFNRKVGKDGSVGIWHETYLIEAGNYESVYVNMPSFGLAAASESIPAEGKKASARGRLGMSPKNPG